MISLSGYGENNNRQIIKAHVSFIFGTWEWSGDKMSHRQARFVLNGNTNEDLDM